MNCNIYLRDKVDKNIQETFIKINEMIKSTSMRNIAEFNLFPEAQYLFAIEKKYSDSLNNLDIFGIDFKTKEVTIVFIILSLFIIIIIIVFIIFINIITIIIAIIFLSNKF